MGHAKANANANWLRWLTYWKYAEMGYLSTGFHETSIRLQSSGFQTEQTYQYDSDCDEDPECLLITLCCRNDGPVDDLLTLPHKASFYLFPVTGTLCYFDFPNSFVFSYPCPFLGFFLSWFLLLSFLVSFFFLSFPSYFFQFFLLTFFRFPFLLSFFLSFFLCFFLSFCFPTSFLIPHFSHLTFTFFHLNELLMG